LCTGESDYNDEEEEFIREGVENTKKAMLQLVAEEFLKVRIYFLKVFCLTLFYFVETKRNWKCRVCVWFVLGGREEFTPH